MAALVSKLVAELKGFMLVAQNPQREAADSVLAKNLVVARLTARITQQDLASAADISRATIAQLETGYSDPRLSTIVDLAKALGISPILLLIGVDEVRALVKLANQLETNPVSIPTQKLELMRQYVQSGLLKDRLRASQLGAELSGQTGSVAITSAILSAIIPGEGTSVGVALGNLLSSITF